MLVVIALLTTPSPTRGQDASIEGRVRDTGGVPVAAALVELELEADTTLLRQTETDRLGFFRFVDLASDRFTVRVGRLGYGDWELRVPVEPASRVELEVTLEEAPIPLEGISVSSEASRDRARFDENTGLTARDVDARQLKLIPGVGEADPVRAVETLPGVTSVSDFSAAFNVRGGSADQNLVVLDGTPVFSPFHLGGLFSVFNSDMVERVELLSGGFPARYGERVSSVLNVVSDPGDGSFAVDGAVSVVASRAAVQGSLPRGARALLGLQSARWRLSARRSYFDVLLRPFMDFPYHLIGTQGVLEAWTRSGDRLSVTGYAGGDALRLDELENEEFPLRLNWKWGNRAVGACWLRPTRGGGSVEVAASFSRFSSAFRFPDFSDTDFSSSVDRAGVEMHVERRPAPRWTLSMGAVTARSTYLNRFISGGTVLEEGFGHGWHLGGYLSGRWEPRADWAVEAGMRADGWYPGAGPGGLVVGPRLSAKRFLFGGSAALKLSAGRYSQFLQSLRNEELPVGIDVWLLKGHEAPGVVSDQLQLGLEAFPAEGWFIALEGYVRGFDGVVAINTADDPNDEGDDVLVGRGWVWGGDLYVQRTVGATTGWLSVSVQKGERTFPDVRLGMRPPPEASWPPSFDRRFEMDLVAQRSLGWNVEAGLRWNLATGLPFTRPVGGFTYHDVQVGDDARLSPNDPDGLEGMAVLLGSRNAERFPLRHRLDISLRKRISKSWGTLTPFLDLLNIYDRRNVLFYFYEYDLDPPRRSGISMIPILPTVGLEVRFR